MCKIHFSFFYFFRVSICSNIIQAASLHFIFFVAVAGLSIGALLAAVFPIFTVLVPVQMHTIFTGVYRLYCSNFWYIK